MKYVWLNKSDENKNLIVFFNGWAMNETAVKHLNSDKFDILMLFDYRTIDFDFSDFNFEKYETKTLVAFSMGVFTANKFAQFLNNFNKKIAINGTGKIVDDNFGIPEKIYKITAKFLNEDSLDKFIKNMFKGDIENHLLNPEIKITRTAPELKEELYAIWKYDFDSEIKFDKAIISKNDRIIPYKNQVAFWQNRTEIETIDSTHCPFGMYTSWQELIC